MDSRISKGRQKHRQGKAGKAPSHFASGEERCHSRERNSRLPCPRCGKAPTTLPFHLGRYFSLLIATAVLGWLSGDVVHLWEASTEDAFPLFAEIALWSIFYPISLANWETHFLWPQMVVPGVLMVARVEMLDDRNILLFAIFSGIVLLLSSIQIGMSRSRKLRRPKVE